MAYGYHCRLLFANDSRQLSIIKCQVSIGVALNCLAPAPSNEWTSFVAKRALALFFKCDLFLIQLFRVRVP